MSRSKTTTPYTTTREAWAAARERVSGIFARFRPPPKLRVSEWAAQYRYLSAEASAAIGRWRNETTPYLIEPMDTLSPDSENEETVLMFSSQVGKTECCNNFIGYIIDQDPGPALVVQPNDRMAKTWSTKRLAPMIRDCPTLAGKVAEAKSRDSSNTIDEKSYPGGYLAIVSSNSAAGLASRPIRYALFDEVDRYQATTEGDPVALGSKRTATYFNRKILKVSSPSYDDVGIDAEYKRGDMRQYWVPCPHCGELQVLRWKNAEGKPNLRWPKGEPERAYYVCEPNGCVIEHKWLRWMLDPANGARWIKQRPEVKKVASFWLNQLYSPFKTWGETAEEFLGAYKDYEKLKTFVNTALAETWREPGEDLEYKPLMARREAYGPAIPQRVVALTAGVDVQGDRLEALLYGFAPGEESWVIEKQVFVGSPAHAQVWRQLDEYLLSTFEHEAGIRMRIAAVGVDTGGQHTQRAYAFCKPRYERHVYAMKGSNQSGMPVAPPRPKNRNKGKVHLFTIGTDSAKSLIYGRLRGADPGPGFVHFHAGLDEEFFIQLTSERLVRQRDQWGRDKFVWELKPGVRNEVLDMSVYALAALYIRNLDLARLYEQLQALLSTREQYGPAHPSATPPPATSRGRGRRMIHGGVTA